MAGAASFPVPGADQAAGFQGLCQGILRGVRQVWEAVEGENFCGGAEKNPGPVCRQLRSQGPQEGGLPPSTDNGGDAGADAQQPGKAHGGASSLVVLYIE